MSEKSRLRRNYEKDLGREIDDRTWLRVRTEYLSIADEWNPTQDDVDAVKGLAFLRKIRQKGKVRRQQAIRFGLVVEKFNYGGFGRDIAAAISVSFEPAPNRTTLWRWGIRMDRWHSKEDVIQVLGYLLGSDRYKLREDQPRMLPMQMAA